MSGEPQLERSVLEGKERDKLQAIADALGLKIPARAKKSDLIDGILRATGVEVGPPAEAEPVKPKRTARRRVTAVPEVAADANGPGDDRALPAAGDNGQFPAADPVPEAAAGTGDRVPEPTAAAAATPADGDAAAPEGGPAGAVDGARRAAPPSGAEPRPQPPRPQVQAVGPPGPGNAISPPPTQNHQPPSPAQHQAGQAGQAGQPGHGAPAEGGEVRRNRRRRGRDRDRAGYDQQAQQADQVFTGDPIPCDGLLELRPEGFGFLRTSGYLPGGDDVYVSTSQVRKFALRGGDRVVGTSRPPTTQERFGALLRIDAVGDQSPDDARRRPRFEDLTPVFPSERLTLELGDPADPANTTGRIIDLLSPIGKGQRGMIVSPPKAGKTTVVKHIATAIEANHPDVELMVLLVDERPEEVTDMRRSVKGEVIGSTFDRPPDEHAHVAELAIEVAKRRVELGGDVVVIVDGITRLARAYNLSAPTTGRIMPGGVDSGALYPPKKLFGAARNIEEGGSLTILATALVETGSTMDTVIFEEFKGTGNMELRLDRQLAERRMYPAVDVTSSSTRSEELLLSEGELRLVWELRRALAALAHDGSSHSSHSSHKAYELLLDKLQQTRTNSDLLAELARSPA